MQYSRTVTINKCPSLLTKTSPKEQYFISFSVGGFDTKFSKYTKCDLYKILIAVLDMATRDELTQVHGIEFFVDYTNYDSKHRSAITMEERRKLMGHITAVSLPLSLSLLVRITIHSLSQ